MVVYPFVCFLDVIPDQFKEQDLVGGPRDQSGFINHVHLTQASVSDFITDVFRCIWMHFFPLLLDGNSEGMALSVERVDFVVQAVVLALPREVLVVTSLVKTQWYYAMLGDLLGFVVVNEVVVRECTSVVAEDEQTIIINKATGSEWLVEVINGHAVIVDS